MEDNVISAEAGLKVHSEPKAEKRASWSMACCPGRTEPFGPPPQLACLGSSSSDLMYSCSYGILSFPYSFLRKLSRQLGKMTLTVTINTSFVPGSGHGTQRNQAGTGLDLGSQHSGLVLCSLPEENCHQLSYSAGHRVRHRCHSWFQLLTHLGRRSLDQGIVSKG